MIIIIYILEILYIRHAHERTIPVNLLESKSQSLTLW